MKEKFMLPDFFFRQNSLVKLRLCDCAIRPMVMLYWGNLTDLRLENCHFDDEVIRSILSDCPLLQSLEIWHRELPGSYQSNRLVISSKSLKRLVFLYIDCYFDIFCPKLVEFVAFSSMPQSLVWCDKVLENFLLDSPLLESLTFLNYELPNFRICSKVLKKLALWGVVSSEIEISCPNLEKLELAGLDVETIRLMNLPCSVSASLDCNIFFEDSEVNVAKQILEQLQHVKDLELGNSFVEILSDLEMSGVSCPLMTGKSLTLKSTSFEHIPGIVFALCTSPVLEILVVILEPDKSQSQKLSDLSDLNRLEENCWNSNETHFGNLVSRLKNVRIFGFSEREGKPKLVLDFVECLLENAIMLENILVDVEGCGTGFMLKVSEKLLSFPRHSKATIKLDY